jgi:hypothetical protein
MVDGEQLRQLLNVFGRGLGLAVEEGGAGDLVASDDLGDLLEGEVLLLLGFEERR